MTLVCERCHSKLDCAGGHQASACGVCAVCGSPSDAIVPCPTLPAVVRPPPFDPPPFDPVLAVEVVDVQLGWPIAMPSLSSGFGRRLNPKTGQPGQLHPGLDFRCPLGTPVLAGADGLVVAAGLGGAGQNPDKTYGLRVVLEHRARLETTSNHLSALVPGLKAGTKVAKGQRIGLSGGNPLVIIDDPAHPGQKLQVANPLAGVTTGPHLHYELRLHGKRGIYFDPMACLPGGKGLHTAASWEWGHAEVKPTAAAHP